MWFFVVENCPPPLPARRGPASRATGAASTHPPPPSSLPTSDRAGELINQGNALFRGTFERDRHTSLSQQPFPCAALIFFRKRRIFLMVFFF